MKKILFIALWTFYTVILYSQDLTQTIRGSVVDKESKFPLIGANIVLLGDTNEFVGTTANENGDFLLKGVQVGRNTIKISFIGYEPIVLSNIIVGSTKEVILDVELEESYTKLKEVEITASNDHGEALNEMATVSSRAFTVEETERYAGSRGDPARMASNFAGVVGSDDSRNDIVIRGNSPMGVLWRLEGVDIPNPNHFAVAGTQGGPTSMINNKYLSNSDFFTGAFPAEYGNSLAGVFDLKMRNGNNQQHEVTAQVGILGSELMMEGPISREKRSSYLVNYRYSTITLFNKLGIDIGTSSKLYYQDAALKFNFPLKNNANLSFFGIGGMSDIDIVISEQKPEEREIYGIQDRDQFFGTGTGVIGASYTKTVNANNYFKITLAQSIENQHSHHQLIYYTQTFDVDSNLSYHLNDQGYFANDSLIDLQRFNFNQGKTSLVLLWNKKIGKEHLLKVGANISAYQFNFQDSLYGAGTSYDWTKRWETKEQTLLAQPYLLWKWRITDKLTLNTGIHSQYFALNNTHSLVEPRVGLNWKLKEDQSLRLGYGRHSQIQAPYIYFYQIPDLNGGFVQHNREMGMSKSDHYVLSYQRVIGKSLKLKAETYYQQLKNIPVEITPSSYSILNQGVGFQRFYPDSLKNTGTGENYGVELTLEKFFENKFFFLATGSYYESFYRGSDGIKRDTDFNGNYILNGLGAKEFIVRKNNTMSIGAKATWAGGKRYGPVDIEASNRVGEIVYIDSERNTKQFSPYFRFDIKLNYKINRANFAHEIAVDLVNVLGNKNLLKLTYAPNLEDPSEDAIREEYQLGFLPIFYYRIDF